MPLYTGRKIRTITALADRGLASNYAGEQVIGSGSGWQFLSWTSGGAWITQGSSTSLAGRPSAALLGEGTWEINGVTYVSKNNVWRTQNILKVANSNIGTRILSGFHQAFDNSTPKTFRSIIEVAAAGFDAVRPIFGNSFTTTYTVAACNVRALGAMTDDINAITPVAVTLPSSGVVPVSVALTRRNYLTGDWTPISSLPRTDGGTGALVCIDAYVSTAGSISVMYGTLTFWASRINRKWRLHRNDGDCVTTPANFVSTTDGGLSPIVGVQYLARGRVITVMGVGDSITEAGGTAGFGTIACETAQTNTGIPFEWVNCAKASTSAAQFSFELEDAIAAGITPQLVVQPIGSPNSFSVPLNAFDVSSCKQTSAYMKRIASQNNVKSINWTVLPTNPNAKDYNSSDSLRVAYNTAALAYPDDIILDFSASLSGVTDVDGQVNMLAGTTTDGIHPNSTGHTILASLLADALAAAV